MSNVLKIRIHAYVSNNNKYLKKTIDIMKIYMNEFDKIDQFNLNIIEILQIFFRNCITKENIKFIKKK